MKEILSITQIQQFIDEGFVSLEGAFPETTAAQCRNILWKEMGLSPDRPEEWKEPVIRLGMYSQVPFVQAANTEALHTAFDQLVGAGNWLPCGSMGAFPIRFPSAIEPNDTGWHVDASFPGDDASAFSEWRVNSRSRGRALLMLFLFSDVGENDAPTRVKAGSHLDVAALLSREGAKGLSFSELAARLDELPERREALVIGKAGTVYLCHPFLVHAAQAHRGRVPKFMAQPPLLLKRELRLDDNAPLTPLEQSIAKGIGRIL